MSIDRRMKDNTTYKGYIIINTSADSCFRIVKENEPNSEKIKVNVRCKYQVKTYIDNLAKNTLLKIE